MQIDRFQEHYSQDINSESYFGMPLASIIAGENKLRDGAEKKLAYFSMEYGLASSFYNTFKSALPCDPHNLIPANTIFSNYRLSDYFFDLRLDSMIDLPIYSGGLGVLAGDTLKTMADYKMAAVGVGILWHAGYFRQRFWFKYGQVPEKMHWHPYSYPGLIPLKNIIKIKLKYEEVYLRIWKYYVYSYKHDYAIPLVLLDADIPQNKEHIRRLTEQLYRSDNSWLKIMQRVILGFGGIVALRELGYKIDVYHLNEGHAVFAFVEKARGLKEEEFRKLKDNFVYTCHTPIEAGHDRFCPEELAGVLNDEDFSLVARHGRESTGLINLTLLAMNTSSSINAVSKSHKEVMGRQFPKYKERIAAVTNGVHTHTWISEEFKKVFRAFPDVFSDFEANPMILSRAKELKSNMDFRRMVWEAHQANKRRFCSFLEKWKLKENCCTVCWARRIAVYKRPSLILQDTKRLVELAKRIGPLQIILAGKAHPNDNLAFTFINEMLDKVDALAGSYGFLKVVIIENYEIYLAQILTSSVDIWLNNPLPPLEASGTSGMKAILNGVIQLTTLDGWVPEAQDKGIGKIFGSRDETTVMKGDTQLRLREDSQELYTNLEELMRLYYHTNKEGKVDLASAWIDMMIDCIATSGYFNTYRMLDQYKYDIWKL